MQKIARPYHNSYAEARDDFRDTARAAGAELFTLAIDARGPAGEALATDIAWFGVAHPRRIFVHCSGTHGVEGFAGSAIQLQWLTEGVNITEDSAVVMVHALNPFGMAWLRRFNENNVDLNRNFVGEEVDCNPPPYWDPVNALLNPASPPGWDGFYARAALMLLRYGMPTVRQAVAGGQRVNPKGLFYGGLALEPGMAAYRNLMQSRLDAAERILVIDVHTGLGRFGNDRLLVDRRVGEPPAVFGDRVEVLGKEGISYAVTGGHHEMYFRSFPKARVFFATQEFGTYGPVRVAAALRAENRWHHYGGGGIDHPTKNALRAIFQPDDEGWRKQVLTRGREVIRQSLVLMTAHPSEF
jgi:Protein of unknown function (DUF2817)